MSDYLIYEGFPDGVSDAFCQHAAVATSQYGTTARALASEVLRHRRDLERLQRTLDNDPSRVGKRLVNLANAMSTCDVCEGPCEDNDSPNVLCGHCLQRLKDSESTRTSLLAELQEARQGRMAEVRLIRSLQDALTDARDELHVTLVKAKETIRVWHGMGMPAESEAHAWALYQASPEMKQINASLGRAMAAP